MIPLKTAVIIFFTCSIVFISMLVYRAGALALQRQADRLERAYNIINN